MKTLRRVLVVLLFVATSLLPLSAQDRDRERDGRDYRGDQHNPTFYRGMRDGGRGGDYNDPRYDNRRYDDRYSNGNGYYQNQGGIGPGKGAAIGAAGGAALGAIFGHGLKSTIIGGAAGAGIGAAVGEVHQRNEQNQYYPR